MDNQILMLPQKSSAKEAVFKNEDFCKYEVVFSMRCNPDAQFSQKMIARILTDDPESISKYLGSQYVKVYKIWPVGRKRGEYLKCNGVRFNVF